MIFSSFFIFISGSVVGSFLNCLIWRVRNNESLWGRSYCPKCSRKIAWYDNIPVLSFISLRGKCRSCAKSINPQYPLVEAAVAILFTMAFLRHWPEMEAGAMIIFPQDRELLLSLIRDWVVIFVSVFIFVYDLRWLLIPDIFILPSIALVFSLNIIAGGSPLDLLWMALIGGSFFLVQFLVSQGKWIGGGDIRFGIFMGAALGRIDLLVLAILSAYWIGALVGLLLLVLKKKEWTSRMPLGVFLSIGSILALFFGNTIINTYLSLF